MGKAKKYNKTKRKWVAAVWIIVTALILFAVLANAAMIISSGASIVNSQDAKGYGADCILVLGARVDGDKPSPTLENRLATGVDLYKQGAAPKLLLTGDGGAQGQDEVSVMKQYAIDAGVPPQDIFLDREGFDTYDSVYRAKEVYGAARLLIVTQPYHLYRSLYIAHALGLEALGVSAQTDQKGQFLRDVREVAARCKDFVLSFVKPPVPFSGSVIPIGGDGRTTF